MPMLDPVDKYITIYPEIKYLYHFLQVIGEEISNSFLIVVYTTRTTSYMNLCCLSSMTDKLFKLVNK